MDDQYVLRTKMRNMSFVKVGDVQLIEDGQQKL